MSKSETQIGDSGLSQSIAGYIRKSRRHVTIVFTDIEDSTKYWEAHGDVQGRLMVDLHNRLTFPVIKKFNGKIIKTIGDSIMATFKKPENAIKAAMGMQQILEQARQTDPSFTLRVRIGIHTGLALVEKHDVFGDVVNAAARVESEAKANEILVSESTERAVRHTEFGLVSAGRFKPKGKSQLMSVFRLPWEDFESIIDDIKPGSYLPVVARQKATISAYLATSIGAGIFLYLAYLRYIAADFKAIAVLTLNPGLILSDYPIVIAMLAAVVLAFLVILVRVQAVSHFLLKLLNGGFGFGIGFILLYLIGNYVPYKFMPSGESVLYESKHIFVEVLQPDSTIYAEPSIKAEAIRSVGRGNILLQMDVTRRGGMVWNKVYLGPEESGWIIRISPPKIGVPETRVTYSEKFYFRIRDVYALVLGCLFFVWGFFHFRVSPV